MLKFILSILVIFQYSILIADGELDKSFGIEGKVITKINGKSAHAQDITILSNGTIVLAGGSTADQFNWDFVIAYYSANGTQNPTFGEIITNGGTAYTVVIQKNNMGKEKVIAAGDWLMVRYNTDGTLDNTFGLNGNGKIATVFTVRCIVIQKDGKILVAGWKSEGESTNIAIARYSSNGILDTTFGNNKSGIVTINIGKTDRAFSIAIDSSEKILLAGSTDKTIRLDDTDLKFVIVRLDKNGTLDSTFGERGIVVKDIITDIDDRGKAIAIDHGDRIIIGGTSGNGSSGKYSILCLNREGEPDKSFGIDGVSTGNINGYMTDLILQHNHKILVSGTSGNNASAYFTVARYNMGGTLDTLFGSEGLATVDFGSYSDIANSIMLQRDGKIVAAGSNGAVGNSDFVIVRFKGEKSLLTIPLSPLYYLLLN